MNTTDYTSRGLVIGAALGGLAGLLMVWAYPVPLLSVLFVMAGGAGLGLLWGDVAYRGHRPKPQG